MRKICIIEGCGLFRKARGLCSKHLGRLVRNGDPNVVTQTLPGAAREVFERSITFMGDECLIWPFARNRTGYGVYRSREVHRQMCIRVNGPPPSPNHQAAHTCGNGKKGCFNPRHLMWKTAKENHADKITHGSLLRGEGHPMAQLTVDQVREILQLKGCEIQRITAERYGVSRRLIGRIQMGQRWKHISVIPS